VEDEHRRIVVSNPKFCELFGIPVPPEEIVGMDCSESAEQNKHFFKDPEGFVKGIDVILENKKIIIGEELHMENGKILERDYVPIFIEESYFGHLWKYRDVTLPRLLSSELESARNDLKVTFDTITEGVVLQTNTGEIVNFNPAACKILKMTENQLLGKSSLDEDWNSIKEDGSPFPGEEHPAMLALKTKKSIFNTIMGVRFRKESVTWININAVLLPDNQGVVCSFSDITERKQMEDDKIKYIKLEASNKLAEQTLKAREEFLANMSHEIRTPMNSIIGLSNLMDKAGELNKKQRSYLDVIQLNSENLLNIINDILDYSKLESGKFEIEKIDFHLPETIKNIVTSMQVLADKYAIHILLNIDSKLPIYVKGDSLRISQILTNLVSNAIKFSDHKEVRIEIEHIQESDKNITYRIKVIDNGIGVSPEKIAEIIKPFTQESSSTTRQYGGTGLGLSIVSKLLEYMGSKLEIESSPGKGSTFSFVLTQEKGSQVGIQEKSALTKLIGKYFILLVEDNQFNQFVAIDTLKDWNPNLEIFIANNGQEALDLLEKQCVDIILMDIQMPIMDGYTATKLIRSSEKHWQNTPIVAMTAHASSMEVEKCMNIGMNGYLSKPFHQSDLFEKITQFIYSHEREAIADKNSVKEIDMEKTIPYNNLSMSSHIVDTEFILNFTKGKIERIEKMVQMFLEETPEELINLEEYFHSKQYSNLKTIAHSFKPKYTYMGMSHLSEIAKQIEHNANVEENLEETKLLIETLKEETQKAYRELSEFLAAQK
jgi:PAS domain S-box-containing protein